MFKTGQQVVCIDDQFDPWVFDLYKSLPKKDEIYTVRALRAGRSNPQFVVNDDAEIKLAGAEFDLLLLLKELNNPDDPHSSVKQEMGAGAGVVEVVPAARVVLACLRHAIFRSGWVDALSRGHSPPGYLR
jgi:hypothetical protein